MNVFVSSSTRFAITEDGVLWTPKASLQYAFWSRYLEVFDGVRLLARARPCDEPPAGWKQASGPGVEPVVTPYYEGPVQYLAALRGMRAVIRRALDTTEAVSLRVPCALATQIWRLLEPGRPYSVEVVGDPYDVFSPGAVQHPLRPFFRWWYTRAARRQCANACAAAYVNATTLPARYPAGSDAFSTSYSSIRLLEEAFGSAPRGPADLQNPWRLVTVGTIEQMYKAPDVLIDAVAQCVRNTKLPLQLTIVGGGKHRADLEARATQLGIGDAVRFTGQLPSAEAVREELDAADLFVLPSRQEGLPKGLIEAMARGLPCIGSTVGGIPELLEPEYLVPPGEATALAEKIREVVTDPERMARMSARNIAKAREYHEDVLSERRRALYSHLRKETETWLKSSSR